MDTLRHVQWSQADDIAIFKNANSDYFIVPSKAISYTTFLA